MSRKTVYSNDRFTLITGFDQMVGLFFQLYDNEMCDETPDGEGIVLEWSQGEKFVINLTGVSKDFHGDIEKMSYEYMREQYILDEPME